MLCLYITWTREISYIKIPKSTMDAIRKRYAAKLKPVGHLGGGDARSETTPVSAARKTRIRPGKKRMRPLIRKVKRIISLNPRKSMRNITRQVDVSPKTLTRIVHQDLGLKSYVLRVKQLLTKEMKKRVGHGKSLLSSLKKNAKEKIRVFCDELLFTTDQKANRRNDRFIGSR